MVSEAAVRWEGQVVNGLFPLRRYLGGSDHSAVFLTESAIEGFLNAAIKIVPAGSDTAAAQIAYWKAAIALPHPHLIRLLEAGACELDGGSFLFVVMEYAEETLAQVLPIRALAGDEVEEMLLPTLGVLGSLHANRLVHGQLRPTNFLVVDDQLKLSSDTIRPAGSPPPIARASSIYDPPEANLGGTFAAGDVWGLGITLIESLTQHAPGAGADIGGALVGYDVPPRIAGIVRGCVSSNPADRPSVADIETQVRAGRERPAAAPPASSPPPDRMRNEPEAARYEAPLPAVPKVGRVVRIVAGLLIVCACGWAGIHLLTRRNGGSSAPSAESIATSPAVDARAQSPTSIPGTVVSETDPLPSHAARTSPSPQISAAAPAASPTAVLHQEIPVISRGSRDTIRGRIKVPVRVTVDGGGRVTHATLESAGTSKYFDRMAAAAALKWTFAPSAAQPIRHWRLRFEFTQEGTSARAEPAP